MRKFEIIVDSTCDFELEKYSEIDVNMIPFHVSADGVNYARDWTEVDPRDFPFKLLNNPSFIPKTSTPAPEEFIQIFEKAHENGRGVLVLCATQTLTSVIRTAEAAKNTFLESCPDAEIEIMDSRLMTAGLSGFVMEAVKLRDEGVVLKEAFSRLIKARDESIIFFMNGGTKYLALGGRIGKVAAVATGILSIKPMIVLKAGEISSFGAVRARGKGPAKLVAAAKEYITSKSLKIQDFTIWPGASYDVWGELSAIRELIEKELGVILGSKENIVVGPAVVAHAGPGILGFGLIRIS